MAEAWSSGQSDGKGRSQHRRAVVAMLLPVGVLVGLATLALARDWQAARRDALALAQELAVESVRGLVAMVDAPGSESGGSRGSDPVDEFEIGDSNELVRPHPYSWPPIPVELRVPGVGEGEGGSEVAGAWAAGQRAGALGDWAAAEAAWRRVLAGLGTSPGEGGAMGRHRVLARYEHALALERLGHRLEARAEYDFVLAEVGGGGAGVGMVTEAGLPVEQLAALRLLDLAGGEFAGLPSRWRAVPAQVLDGLARSRPSPFLTRVFEHVNALAGSPPGLGEAFRRVERVRRRHAEAAARWNVGGAWPEAFWLGDGSPGSEWVFVARRGEGETEAGRRRYAMFGEAELRAGVGTAMGALDRRGAFFARAKLAGRVVGSGVDEGGEGRESGVLAETARTTAGGVAVVVEVGLRRSSEYFAEQRRRVWVFGGMIGLAAAASVVAAGMTGRALRRQHALNRAKSNFVSSVSHELRAPLGSIRLLAEGLERGTAGDEAKRREYFRLIGQETRRLGALVENVLDFSRIDQGRKRYEFEPADLRAMVEGTLRVFEPLAEARGVRVGVEWPGDGTSTEAVVDGRALQQALLNLLDNALKHSPAGAVIGVRLASEDAGARYALSVTDDGPGIPAEEQQRVFEPFYRRGSELRRETQGVGIGLAIVRHVVGGHGGRVDLESEPGRGARFTLRIPADARGKGEDGPWDGC